MTARVALDSSLRGLDDCGCCAGTQARTPEPVSNRPGLAKIDYRVGTHTTFLASLLADLSTADRVRLQRLSTREAGDFTIAFLDAVATAADVLSFYAERIANESYLRTATERLSVLELARAIGYELNPGVAAETVLAFEIEEAEGAPPLVQVEPGAKVQSVPGPGERPQTFETVEPIEARAEWNELRPRLTELRNPAIDDTQIFVKGVATNLVPGDAILIVGDERAETPGKEQWDFRLLDTVDPDPDRGVTRLAWKPPLGSHVPRVEPASREPRVYALRLKTALFGASAPDWLMLPPATREIFLGVAAEEAAEEAKAEPKPKRRKKREKEDEFTREDWPRMTIAAISEHGIEEGISVVHLDGLYSELLAQPHRSSRPESWLVLSRQEYQELYRVVRVDESARQRFGLALKTTRVELEGENMDRFNKHVRDAVAYAQSEPLELAETPIEAEVQVKDFELEDLVAPLPVGRVVAISGRLSKEPEDAPPTTELATVVSSEVVGAHTLITLERDLKDPYVRETVRIAANVAAATHGESTEEPIGSGDASQGFQRFKLRQAPLTHVYARTASGRRSTLELRVGGVRWQEVPSLFERGPHERVFATSRDDEGATTVEVGDGRTGARLPSGPENVVAAYRKGLGREGNLEAGKLALLTTRPLGVRGVSNPLPASGGVDPEQLAEARRNAPLTVLTLGRIVSLADYADFARAFEGVAKAHATWVWGSAGRGVLLTVAGANGDPVAAESALREKLLEAVADASDPQVEVHFRSYDPVKVHLAAEIVADDGAIPEQLLAACEATLSEHFSFVARSFGQAVPLSEVLAVLHGVTGVASVDVNGLYAGEEAELRQRIPASVPRPGDDADSAPAAQLLTLDLRTKDLEVIV